MRRVNLRIVSEQSDGYTTDQVDESYDAVLTDLPNGASIRYQRLADHGEKVHCRLFIGEEGIEISNRGPINSLLTFEPGIRHRSVYETPFGKFPIETETKALKIERIDDEIRAEVVYQLYSDGKILTTHDMKITVR